MDDCDLYGQLLAKKLKNYRTYERHLLMHEIDGLLLQKPPGTAISPSSSTYSSPPTPYPINQHVSLPIITENQASSTTSNLLLPHQSPSSLNILQTAWRSVQLDDLHNGQEEIFEEENRI